MDYNVSETMLRDREMERWFSCIIQGVRCNRKSSDKWKKETGLADRSDVWCEEDSPGHCWLWRWNGDRSHGMWQLLEAGTDRWILLEILLKGREPCQHLDCCPVRTLWPSYLQNRTMIYLHCFVQLSLWPLPPAAMEN